MTDEIQVWMRSSDTATALHFLNHEYPDSGQIILKNKIREAQRASQKHSKTSS
jgi:hypothetical protein